jgi:hypothetical protein
MTLITISKGKCLIQNKRPVGENAMMEAKKEENLEPIKEVKETKEIKGNGFNELQQRLSNLKFSDEPIKQILKGERKKRNISFTY